MQQRVSHTVNVPTTFAVKNAIENMVPNGTISNDMLAKLAHPIYEESRLDNPIQQDSYLNQKEGIIMHTS